MHTASRPPSTLLGAAIPASPSLTEPQNFNVLGLPPAQSFKPAEYDGMPRAEIAEDFFGFDREKRSRKTSRVGQPGEVDRTTATAELAAARGSLVMMRTFR
jgi:hypothetical protein